MAKTSPVKNGKKKIVLVFVSIFTLGFVGYSSNLLYKEWVVEAPNRADAAKQRDRWRKIKRVQKAEKRLKANGVTIQGAKGSFQGAIDFSKWHGTMKQFEDLKEFALLLELYPYEQHGVKIRLGPSFDDSVVPILQSIPNLEHLDLGKSSLSENAIEQIRAYLSYCKIGRIEGFEQ